jgi:hypothetical protein
VAVLRLAATNQVDNPEITHKAPSPIFTTFLRKSVVYFEHEKVTARNESLPERLKKTPSGLGPQYRNIFCH